MANVGLARVSTKEQSLEAQIKQLESEGCIRIFSAKQSGKSGEHKNTLNEMIEFIRAGDTVLVTKLDRLGRSLNIILDTIRRIQKKGAQLRTLDGQINTESDEAMQKAMTQMIAVFAELEHSIIVDRLQTGRQVSGKKGGRSKVLTSEQVEEVINAHKKGTSIRQLALQYNTSRPTIGRVVKDTYNK